MFPEIQVLLGGGRGEFTWVSRYEHVSAGLWLCVILTLVSFRIPAREAVLPEQKTVVLLYPDPRLLSESIAVEQGIRSTLEAAVASGIDFYTEYLDLGLLSEDRSERLLTRFLRQKYQGRKGEPVI